MAKVFVSHITEEAELASRIKTALELDFLKMVEVFASSSLDSIHAGDPWLTAIQNALQEADILMVLCSRQSVTRPWINFEVGAAWARNIRIVPFCHSGMVPRDLLMPLSVLNAIDAARPESLKRLYTTIAAVQKCAPPVRSFETLSAEWHSLPVGQAAGTSIVKPVEVHEEAAKTSELSPEDRRNLDRLLNALRLSDYDWRTIAKIASEAAVTDGHATRLLQGEPSVRFAKGKSGRAIVGLISRVGPTARRGR